MTNSEVNKAISFLEKGEIILCPTDTIWGISCNATNFEAVTSSKSAVLRYMR